MGPRSGGTRSERDDQDTSVKGVQRKTSMKVKSVVFKPILLNTSDNTYTTKSNTTKTSNRYNVGDKPLSEFDEDFDMNKDDDSSVKNDKQNTKKQRNAPIIIVGKNVSQVQKVCNEKITSKKFECKLLSIGIRVDVQQKDEFDNFCAFLDEKKIPHFMYQTAETRPRKIVLYGLYQMPIETVKELLADVGVTPFNITTLRLRENRYHQQSVYLLYFKSGSVKLSELRKIKQIDNIIVKWEPYTPRSNNILPQCRNCQVFGHSSDKCHMPPRCLVCADNHKTDECKKKIPRAVLAHKITNGDEIDTSYVKCANCHEKHPASYGGCAARKTYIEIQNKIRRPKQRRAQVSYHYNDVEFPEMPQSSSNNNNINVNTQNYRHTLMNNNIPPQDNTMQQFMMTMMNTFNKLIDKLSSMIEQLTRSLGAQQTKSP